MEFCKILKISIFVCFWTDVENSAPDPPGLVKISARNPKVRWLFGGLKSPTWEKLWGKKLAKVALCFVVDLVHAVHPCKLWVMGHCDVWINDRLCYSLWMFSCRSFPIAPGTFFDGWRRLRLPNCCVLDVSSAAYFFVRNLSSRHLCFSAVLDFHASTLLCGVVLVNPSSTHCVSYVVTYGH